MAVKMRLTRMGDKKSPFYRVVVIDSRKAQSGEYIDKIGYVDPLKTPAKALRAQDEQQEKEEVIYGYLSFNQIHR